MSGRIPQSFVDDLIGRTDIVEVIDEYVPLKRQGRDFAACCPFHDEKTPSFTVSREKQFYYCFGCQATGSTIGFLMEFRGLGFVDAIEELAERHGLEVPREGGNEAAEPRESLEPIYDILRAANTFYQRQLREHSTSERAVGYLKGRGLTGEVAARYHIGYAPPGWDNLSSALGTTHDARSLLEKAGLSTRREGGASSGLYDRLRDRIVFPIYDPRGRVIGFGGRVLDDSTPKYLNSPESAVFHKGRELYGLFEAQRVNRRPDALLVVEGYMDVVALAQHGVDYAVATLGTAVTREHLEKLYRVSRDVVFCFDGDAAGRRAAWRALETSLPLMRAGRRAAFLFMPEGEDPDSYVRSRGAAELASATAAATPLSDYLFEHQSVDVDLTTVEGQARLLERCRPLIGAVPGGPFQELLHNRLAEIARLPPGKLTRLLGSGGGTAARGSNRPPRAPASRGAPSLVRRAVHLLLHDPGLASGLAVPRERAARLSGLQMKGVEILQELLELLAERPDLGTGAVLEHFRDSPHAEHLARLAASPPPLLGGGLDTELDAAMSRLESAVREQRYDLLTNKSAPLTAEEKAELRDLLSHRSQVTH